MLRAISVSRPPENRGSKPTSTAKAVLRHDDRHLRRKAITLSDGSRLLVDLPHTVVLNHGDALVLENGSAVAVEAAEEELYEITGRDARHLVEIAWHIGNRHLPAAVSADRILILRDHVIRAMLEGLGASVRDVTTAFSPLRGAYADNGQHGHHDHGHDHDHPFHHHHHHAD